jgi:hypothetical protein
MARKQRKSTVDLSRLCDAIRSSIRVLEPYRAARREAARRYAGDQWSTETARVSRPVNFLSLYMQLVSRAMIASSPRVTIGTMKKQHKAVISAMEEWANPEIVKMGLAESLQRGGVDALYGFHVMKVALATPGESERSGWTQKAGQPFAQCIDLDDWVMDHHARTLRDLSWCGHRSRVPLDAIKDSSLYEKAKRKFLQANPDRQFNQAGDERISMLGRQYVSNDYVDAYDMIDIWEIYLPYERMVLTLLSNDGDAPDLDPDGEAFDERPWVGPDDGPYHFLTVMPPVPGNAMPKGPIQDLIDLDEALNGCFQKLINQAARQKDLLGVSGQADGDAERIMNAKDGEVVRIDNPDKVKPMGFGGANPNNQQFVIGLWDFLNKLGGNVELMGGLGAQSKTATQDKMLNANSGMSIRWMQQAMVAHTAKVTEALCWFWHHHPVKTMTSYHPVEGLPNPIERKVTPAERHRIPFEELSIDIDPYSLQHQSPEEKLGFLNQVVTQILTPLMPLLQQQGISLDVGRYLELVAEYGSSTDLQDIVTSIQPQDSGASAEGPTKPGNTTRQYNRVNSSEKTSEGQGVAMRQALAGQSAGGDPNSSYAGS